MTNTKQGQILVGSCRQDWGVESGNWGHQGLVVWLSPCKERRLSPRTVAGRFDRRVLAVWVC